MNPTGSNDVRAVEGYPMYLFNELELARSHATSNRRSAGPDLLITKIQMVNSCFTDRDMTPFMKSKVTEAVEHSNGLMMCYIH
jgi:hypothetical protein